MRALLLILSICLLTACAEREKQPEQTPPPAAPPPVNPQPTTVSKFKGLQVKKPVVMAAPNNDPIPAAPASAAPDAK